MNLAYKYPIIFWNCACLISNSGSLDEDGSTDYGKIAKALGEIISKGIKVSLVDINKSSYSFEPDVINNQILFGMKAVSNVNTATIDAIIKNRPYISFKDFLNKCPLNKAVMVSLIKSGAFDNLENKWAKELKVQPRILIMAYYLYIICDKKKRLTLQNFNGLMQKDLIPDSLQFQKEIFLFNKTLKTQKKGNYYLLNQNDIVFYLKHFDGEKLNVISGFTCILQTDWDKIYKNVMDKAREWLKEEQDEVLKEFNELLFSESWDKYASGTVSAWEMESLCFYYGEHELKNVNIYKYGIRDYFSLSENPDIDYFFKRNGKEIPIYKIYKIIGTVIGKNDTKSTITLLTTNGVVNVKFNKEYYANYARQISEIQEDGTKKVKEKSWFTRGTKLMVQGFKRDDTFVAKRYKNTLGHTLYKITDVNKNGDIILVHNRYGENENK